jgi:hypothetical protein
MRRRCWTIRPSVAPTGAMRSDSTHSARSGRVTYAQEDHVMSPNGLGGVHAHGALERAKHEVQTERQSGAQYTHRSQDGRREEHCQAFNVHLAARIRESSLLLHGLPRKGPMLPGGGHGCQ